MKQPQSEVRNSRWGRIVAAGAAVSLLALAWQLMAQEQPAPIVVQLVADFENLTLVSDLEQVDPVTETEFTAEGSREIKLGDRATLWVRNAHVDGKHFFERYYQEKFIGRRARIEIPASELAAGEHFIEPGHHAFTVQDDGQLRSADPDVRTSGRTVSLRLYRVNVRPVDAARSGPAEFRLVPASLGLLAALPDWQLDPAALPDLKATFEPRKAQQSPATPRLVDMLSQSGTYLSLSVWLPANTEGAGYVLHPSWQAFHLLPGGRLQASEQARVPGVELADSDVTIPYHIVGGRISSRTNLNAGVGAVQLATKMSLGPSLNSLKFVAGHEKPADDLFLLVDQDATRQPFKYFVADNTLGDKEAISLAAFEWDRPVFERGAQGALAVRLLQTPGHETFRKPVARVDWSDYQPSNPASRNWQSAIVLDWQPAAAGGKLRFRVPDVDFQFIMLRVQLFEEDDARATSPLSAEIAGCVVEHGQRGSASVIASKARNAFVAGETIRLEAALRSQGDRPPGRRTLVLVDPAGHRDELPFDDPGTAWCTQPFELPADVTARLPAGRYTLTFAGLPEGIAAAPFRFAVVSPDKPSLFHVVKPSKYTKDMNNLEPSHLSDRFVPIDLDRAVETLADLGYTRIDLMSYMVNHHLRGYTFREKLAELDPRLPAPEAVYTPTPREQLLNACVRERLQYSDVWLSYGDFHLPRQIEPYIQASERWMARETQAMRHSPAFDGMMLYDEMYQQAVTGIVEHHQKYFAAVRSRLAEEKFGLSPSKIEQAITRYQQRPPAQRDPAALAAYLAYQDWQQHSWAEYVNRVVAVGKQVSPAARFGTYHRTWMSPGANDDIIHGYPPDLFRNLDIISHVHYADNITCWVSVPLMAGILRTGRDKTLYVSMPLAHEARTNFDGQYTRQMALAMLSMGANGISQWGLLHSFDDGPNPHTAQARETVRIMNREILQPFGAINDHTSDGYRRVGIVSTLNQHATGQIKALPTANQSEGIAVACWRLGYPAVFLREDTLAEPLDGFQVLFVPGVRFDGELAEPVVKRLKEALAQGIRVVVEAGSALDLPGITKLDDWKLDSYFLGDSYFPTWADDELNKVYRTSQPIVDYLAPKLVEWNIEPAARGDFRVGPNWRNGGAIQYLIHANFDDPPYDHTVKQQMAQPKLQRLQVAKSRGSAAYDLLARQPLKLSRPDDGNDSEQALTLDLRRVQGAIVAFTPEPVGSLQADFHWQPEQGKLRVGGTLIGASGRSIDGVFPAEITVRQGESRETFHRILGRSVTAALTLAEGSDDRNYTIEVRETLAGHTVEHVIAVPARHASPLRLVAPLIVEQPYPDEVQRHVRQLKSVVIVPSAAISGADRVAADLAGRLKAQGIETRVAAESTVYRRPTGNPKSEDPLGDGFHSWHGQQEAIGPALVVDQSLILLGGRHSSVLVDALAEHGYLSRSLVGEPGKASRPSVQLATKGLHFAHDTLCLLANDATGLQAAADAILAPAPAAPEKPVQKTLAQTLTDQRTTDAVPVLSHLGTNELIQEIDLDPQGNLYAITWGHGQNLYSLDPTGKLRFARHLPEMGTNRLNVYADRLLAYTAAGARLYQLSLDNQPLSQARINMDPGTTTSCDDYELSRADYEWLPRQQRLLHNMGERMRVLDPQYRILAEWPGEEYFDKDVADKVLRRQLHGYAISPDGSRIAQLESSMYFTRTGYKDKPVYDVHLVLRDLTGKLLHEYQNIDNGDEVVVKLLWPAQSPGPVIHAPNLLVAEGHERWLFDGELKLVSKTPLNIGLVPLGAERRLVRDGRTLLYYDQADHVACRIGPLRIMPTWGAASPDGKHLALVDEYGRLRIYDAHDGRQRAETQLAELGKVLRFTSDGQRLVCGGFRGSVTLLDLDAHTLWSYALGQANDVLGSDLPLVDPSFPDFTQQLWPESRDEPGQLDQVVRLGANRLVNGSADQDGGWQGDRVAYAAPGYQSSRALAVGPEMVGQEVKDFLGTHATWVLEFFYRAADDRGPRDLLAGLLTESQFSDSVAGHFAADNQWRFGRMVIKNGANCQKLSVGFSAADGPCLVDAVQLRQIRFPSVNHLLGEAFYPLDPLVLENPLYSRKYDPVGNLREQVANKVMIPNLASGALNLVESAWLQNGRLNETSSHWYIQPFSRDSNELPISLGLREPQWVSMLALYFNQYQPQHVTPHIDVYAVDPETGRDKLMASVRHNTQVFRLVKFPPIKTTLVKVVFISSLERHRTLSEIELYGPLSGREGDPAFLDPDGQNTYMGDFTRVDKRHKHLADDYLPPIVRRGTHDEAVQWAAPMTQPLVADNRIYLARSFGASTAHPLDDPQKDVSWARRNGAGYTPFGALYAGLILRCGNDGKLYCLNPDTGTQLWATQLGSRLFGCPVCIGEDVFVASDNGRLYQLDLASGTIMKEAPISGTVFGSLATEGRTLLLISDDGRLSAIDAVEFRQRWQLPIAPLTDSTPAVDQGTVYLADQQGHAQAVDLETGKPRWTTPLGDEFARCPVVAAAHVVFGCRGGTLAVLRRSDGKVLWSKKVNSRFEYEPLVCGDKLLFFRGEVATLARLDNGEETPWQTVQAMRGANLAVAPPFTLPSDPLLPISYYRGRLIFVERPNERSHATLQINQPWHVVGGAFTVLVPTPQPEERK